MDFVFGELDGAVMTCWVNGQEVKPNADNRGTATVALQWPGEIVITLGGKNQLTDTKVDQQGKIIQDKFVQLTNVCVDRLAVSHHFLQKWPLVNNEIRTCYFGFNGTVQLIFDSPSAFHWLIRSK